MKKSIFKQAILLCAWTFTISSAAGQIDTKPARQRDDLRKLSIPITKDMEDKVAEIVRPVIEKLEKVCREETPDLYEGYKRDAENLSQVADAETKMAMVEKMRVKYHEFVRTSWEKADIDEANYQARIIDVFPAELKTTIRFSEFLNFIISSAEAPKSDPDPSPPPLPSNICADAIKTYFTKEDKTVTLGASSFTVVNNSYLHVSSSANIAGHTYSQGWILSDIKIPGTFPSDNRMLRIIKKYRWQGSAMAVPFLEDLIQL